jgi:hypothetical protein
VEVTLLVETEESEFWGTPRWMRQLTVVRA